MTYYTCSNCGASLLAAQGQCPQCGAEIQWEEAVGRTQYVRKLPPLGPPRGPRFGVLLKTSLITIFILATLLLAGLWGIEQGLQERQAEIGEVAFTHYRQGLLHLFDGNISAAQQEFKQVVVVQPQATSTPAAIAALPQEPSPTPAVVTPTPTLNPNQLSMDETLTRIQQLMAAESWAEAIPQLQRLSDLDPGYQTGLVSQMLFNAYTNQALVYIDTGDIDAAARDLDAALAIHANNSAASKLRQAINLYQTGQAEMGQDWDAAIAAFTALYAQAPDFMDTGEQLFLAYAGAGDTLRRSAPCQAMNRYQLALQLDRDPQVRAKLEDTRLRCKPDANDSSIPAVGGPTPSAASGHIAYTLFDENLTYHRTRLWDVAAMQAGEIIAEESLQPDIGPQNGIIVRSTDPEHFGITYYPTLAAPPQRLTQDAGDSTPRWSPDGRSIVFTSASRTPDQQSHLFLLDIAAGSIRDLGLGQGPDWSPDGQRIVYQGCGASETNCGLWILDLTSDEHRQLTSTPSDSMPRWAPDGELIAFMSNGRSPSWDLFVVDASTGNIPFFALDDAIDGMPAWSPSGEWLAFLSNREGDWAVYSWSTSTLTVQRLFPVASTLPDWQEASLDWAP
ncbi:MAG: hypothetical protein GXP37_07605 [Chloroflexi bacterium]|nr:hypothetical protein [Chloroflexota bacterium]